MGRQSMALWSNPEGGFTSYHPPHRWLRRLTVAALVGMSAGCHNLRNQLKALSGSDGAAGASATASSGTAKPSGGGPSVMPKAYGSKGPTAILDQTFRARRDPAERSPGAGLRVPHFDWSGHDARLGGGVGDSPRHQHGS